MFGHINMHLYLLQYVGSFNHPNRFAVAPNSVYSHIHETLSPKKIEFNGQYHLLIERDMIENGRMPYVRFLSYIVGIYYMFMHNKDLCNLC